ncbi:MAG: GtrA family protein [Myxococcales bacterium]|nr:GtrA family protein [Myxococcales bacterium]
MSLRRKRMLRVGCSGVAASVVDVIMLLILVEALQVPVAIAAFLAASTGAIASFAINKFWAFRDPSPIRCPQLSGFALVAFGSALGTALSVQALSVGLGVPYLAAKALAAIALFVCWSYPVQSRLVFKVAHP